MSSATVKSLKCCTQDKHHSYRENDLPKVAEWPKLVVLDGKIIIHFATQGFILPRTTSAPSNLDGLRDDRCSTTGLAAIDLILMFARTWRASPAVTSRWLSYERRVYAAHMEVTSAAGALHCIAADEGLARSQEDVD